MVVTDSSNPSFVPHPPREKYEISRDQLLHIMPNIKNIDARLPLINFAAAEGKINTRLRMSAFLAQIAHESGQLKYTREIWGPSAQQKRYERDFSHPWPPTAADKTNKLAFRLGNSEVGDGYLFRGAGPIQITGRGNSRSASLYTFKDERLIKTPTLLDDFLVGLKMTIWYWVTHNCNQLSDVGDFKALTRAINGGENGLADRMKYYNKALSVL